MPIASIILRSEEGIIGYLKERHGEWTRHSNSETGWMQGMGDILNCIAEQNGWPTPAQLLNMFKRFPPLGKEGVGDDDEETPIAPLDYERVFKPNYSSTKGVVIHNLSQHSST
ncbi:hypothetical protein J1N35_005519 [Gossypium stocksii]|uniref:Uncharacterized protein n=1 Tax=Gossypium stocksii TaxID=47602 RepID=A0A9D4AIN7_9ROSI|nr:hypothetical protein J1N35_005519 [Gossypium stocksii]